MHDVQNIGGSTERLLLNPQWTFVAQQLAERVKLRRFDPRVNSKPFTLAAWVFPHTHTLSNSPPLKRHFMYSTERHSASEHSNHLFITNTPVKKRISTGYVSQQALNTTTPADNSTTLPRTSLPRV
ncbi:hypothetical protein BaRGS_00023685 [Batillaria attramentaria]|uniref:Uncharacterized protein n=1 Tax=Batillaria attramentaria TaxID=370345 RepID=A0ABD0KDH6_9CAEN